MCVCVWCVGGACIFRWEVYLCVCMFWGVFVFVCVGSIFVCLCSVCVCLHMVCVVCVYGVWQVYDAICVCGTYLGCIWCSVYGLSTV